MSENWVKISEKIHEQLKNLEEIKGKDRLELVRSMSFVLNVLQRSLVGWMQWVSNPDIMTIFSQDDLENMTKELANFADSFLIYDMKMTGLGVKKGLKPSKKTEQRHKQRRTERFYV